MKCARFSYLDCPLYARVTLYARVLKVGPHLRYVHTEGGRNAAGVWYAVSVRHIISVP